MNQPYTTFNNPQNPQYSSYSTQYVPSGPCPPFYGQADNSRVQDLQELNNKLNSPWFTCYKVWINLLLIAPIIFVGAFFLLLSLAFIITNSKTTTEDYVAFVGIIIAILWNCGQCVAILFGLDSKDFEKAKRGLLVAIGFAVFYLIFSVWLCFFYLFAASQNIDASVGIFIAFYSIPVFPTLVGAYKIYRILEKRAIIQEEIEPSASYN